MNSKEQHRNATVNDRLDALAKSASEFADATAESLEKIDVRITEDVAAARAYTDQQVAHTRQETHDLIRAAHDGRVHADGRMESMHRAFVRRGFWARMNWLFTGR